MSRDFGRSAGATGQADGEDPPRMDGTSPSGQDGFAWPPREGDEPLAIELLDSTDRSLAYRDQFNSRKAADIHVVSEQPGPAAEPPLRGDLRIERRTPSSAPSVESLTLMDTSFRRRWSGRVAPLIRLLSH